MSATGYAVGRLLLVFLVQYLRYVGDVATGDLGYSYKSGTPVTTLIGQTLPVTGWLMGLGVIFSLVISIPLGNLVGTSRDGWDTIRQ